MADRHVRVSRNILMVLKMMMEKPLTPYSGADMARELGLGSGTLYPLLQRLENAGWLKSEWEKIDPSEAGRPRRRHYKLTGQGQNKAAKALAEVQTTAVGVLAWSS
ncbi:MAG TPA: helix-turn-helix transcriptional regulator [Pseudorhodoplanes sp.]|nr:helix-turn-helix transcriptional regulator [Pseudorhodoplanes sp.]